MTHNGQTVASLCRNKELHYALGGTGTVVEPLKDLPIIPNYLRYPPLIEKVDKIETTMKHISNWTNPNPEGTLLMLLTILDKKNALNEHAFIFFAELVLKVRIANCGDPDFIEIELQKSELTFARLVKVCCEELNTSPNQICKIRKLPNTILRKDKDVQRLTDYQELELMLSTHSTSSNNNVLLSSPITPTVNGNGYESIFLRKNQTILY